MHVSGMRSLLATMFASVICLREWITTGARTYRLNHFGISCDSTGHKPGRPRIQQWLTLDHKGMAASGTFSVDQYDESGNLLAHIEGKVTGTRVTMDTPTSRKLSKFDPDWQSRVSLLIEARSAFAVAYLFRL